MVQQMAAKNFALRNGGQMPIQQPVVAPPVPQQNFFGGGNQAIGKFDAIQTGAAPVTDFTNMPKQQEFIPQGDGFANPTLGSVQAPYMKMQQILHLSLSQTLRICLSNLLVGMQMVVQTMTLFQML